MPYVKKINDKLIAKATTKAETVTANIYGLKNDLLNGDLIVKNSDKVDGFDTATKPTANSIPVADESGLLNDWVSLFYANVDGGNALSNYVYGQALDCGKSNEEGV